MPKQNGEPTKKEAREQMARRIAARQAGYCVRTICDEDAFALSPFNGREITITMTYELTRQYLSKAADNGMRAEIIVDEQG